MYAFLLLTLIGTGAIVAHYYDIKLHAMLNKCFHNGREIVSLYEFGYKKLSFNGFSVFF